MIEQIKFPTRDSKDKLNNKSPCKLSYKSEHQLGATLEKIARHYTANIITNPAEEIQVSIATQKYILQHLYNIGEAFAF